MASTTTTSREGAQPSAEDGRAGGDRVLSNSRHGSGGGESQPTNDNVRIKAPAENTDNLGRPTHHTKHTSSCVFNQASDVQEIRVAHAEDRRVCPRCTFEGAGCDQTLRFSPMNVRLDTIYSVDGGAQAAVQAQENAERPQCQYQDGH